MKNLVTIQEAKAVTSSLQIAQVFSKEHRNVIASIKELLSTAENSALLKMFIESTYIASNGKSNPMYIITRDGFTLLAMGFTGKKALQFKIDYINAFNKMEEHIKNQSAVQVSQPTLPKRKATGKRVETYLPNEDVLRLQIAAYQAGYPSVYSLLQKMIYDFINNGNIDRKVRYLEFQVEYLTGMNESLNTLYKERNQFVGDILPLVQEMNRTIEEERTLRKKYEAKLRQIKQLA